jgi:hypothetical protein
VIGLMLKQVNLRQALSDLYHASKALWPLLVCSCMAHHFIRCRGSTLGRVSGSTVRLFLPVTVRPDETPASDDNIGKPAVIVVPASLKSSESPTGPRRTAPTSSFDLGDYILKVTIGLVLVSLTSLLAQAALLPCEVVSRADEVQAGKPISAIKLGPLTILDIAAPSRWYHMARHCTEWQQSWHAGTDLSWASK